MADIENAIVRGKTEFPRANFFKILIFLALIAGTTILIRPLQIRLLGRMEEIRDRFISQAEDYLGLQIQYGSLGPSIFGVLDIKDIHLLREDNSVFLKVSRIRLAYSFIELVKGNITGAFHSARIDKPVLNLDFNRDVSLLDRFGSIFGESTESTEAMLSRLHLEDLLPGDFSLKLLGGEWEVSDSAGKLHLYNVNLDAALKKNDISFQGRLNLAASMSTGGSLNSIFSVISADASGEVIEAFMVAGIEGELSGNLKEGRASLNIQSFYGDLFRLNPFSVELLLSKERMEVHTGRERARGDVSLFYYPETGRLQASFASVNYAPSESLTLRGAWGEYNDLLAFRISGYAGFETTLSGGFAYNANISGILPERFQAGPASFALSLSGDESEIIFDTLHLDSLFGKVNFNGGLGFNPVAPYGLLSVSGFTPYQGARGVSGDFYINTYNNELSLSGNNISAGDVELSALEVTVLPEDDGVSFSLSMALLNHENVIMSSFALDGSADRLFLNDFSSASNGEERQIRASMRMDSFSVADIFGIMEPFLPPGSVPARGNSPAEDLRITTEVFIYTDFNQILYNAPNIIAAYDGLADIQAIMSLSGTGRRFELNEGRIYWEDGNASVTASIDFSSLNDISFSLGAAHRDLAYFFDGMILDQRSISIRGSYGIQIFLSDGGTGAYSGYARGQNVPVPSGDATASLSFLINGFYLSPSSWQARIDMFEISGLTTPTSSYASLSFGGTASEAGLDISDLQFLDNRGPLEGRVKLNWDESYSDFFFNADLSGIGTSEYYGLEGSYKDKRLFLSVSGVGMQFVRIIPYTVIADGGMNLYWESPESFEGSAFFSSLMVQQKNEQILASVSATINSKEIVVRNLTVNYSGLEAILPNFRINRADSRLELDAVIQGHFSGRPVDIACTGEAFFNPTETWLDILKGFNFLKGSLDVGRARYDTIASESPFMFAFDLIKDDNEGYAMNFSGGPRNMVRFRYSPVAGGGGNFYGALSSPSPVRGSITGFMDSQNIDAQGTDLYIDLGSLWRFVPPINDLAFPGGIFTGNIAISGSLSDPEFHGTIKGTSVQISVPNFVRDTIRPSPMNVSLAGNEMFFGPVEATAGRGAAIVNAWFRFDQWIPNIFAIDIQVPNDTPVPFGIDISGVVASGLASGNLVIGMEDLTLSIDGDLTAHNTEISINTGEIMSDSGPFSDRDDTRLNVTTNLVIRSGRRVEFFWPRDFPIIQAYTDIGTGIRITSNAFMRRFSLTGDVVMRNGEIFYLERNFYIREGTLFFRENETRFDPRLSARAEIRDQSADGPVTISMIIDNAPLMSFEPRFISSPALSQIEIYSLLGQNRQGYEAGLQGSLGATVLFDGITQFTVTRRLQRTVRNFLGLDMFSIRTQLLQNVVLRATSNNASDIGPLRTGNYFDNTTVFIGKYFGANLFGQAMLSFRYDEKKQTLGGLVLEPEIGLEMRNPIFDIQFNLVPLHPETWFVSDASFSLIWRRSF